MSGTDLPAPLTGVTPEESYDVVVVGFGIAGGCAALEAARAGARVLVLERAAVHGGTSAMSGGHFYLGGGTAVQRATEARNAANLQSRRPVLTPEQWSNLFGENMLKASED